MTLDPVKQDYWDIKADEYRDEIINDLEQYTTESEEEEELEPTDELLEFVEITEEECRQIPKGVGNVGHGSPRNIVLLTREEVEEYIKDIPFEIIKGFIPVYNKDGRLAGWKPCLLNDTS